MKTTLGFILMLMIIPLCCCTHNNGDIGPLFGQWKIESVRCEGMPQPEYAGNAFLSFQNSVAQITITGDHNTSYRSYATWHIADNTLFIDFDDADFPPIGNIGLNVHNRLQILRLTHSEMILQSNPDIDISVTYILKKW